MWVSPRRRGEKKQVAVEVPSLLDTQGVRIPVESPGHKSHVNESSITRGKLSAGVTCAFCRLDTSTCSYAAHHAFELVKM